MNVTHVSFSDNSAGSGNGAPATVAPMHTTPPGGASLSKGGKSAFSSPPKYLAGKDSAAKRSAPSAATAKAQAISYHLLAAATAYAKEDTSAAQHKQHDFPAATIQSPAGYMSQIVAMVGSPETGAAAASQNPILLRLSMPAEPANGSHSDFMLPANSMVMATGTTAGAAPGASYVAGLATHQLDIGGLKIVVPESAAASHSTQFFHPIQQSPATPVGTSAAAAGATRGSAGQNMEEALAALSRCKGDFTKLAPDTRQLVEQFGSSYTGTIDLTSCTFATVDLGRNFPMTSTLILKSCTFVDNGAAIFACMKNATSISLALSKGITPELIRHIAKLQKVHTLDLAGCKLPKEVHVTGLRLPSDAARFLVPMAQLHTLNVAQSDFTSESLMTLAQLPLLQVLDVSLTKINSLTPFQHFKKLTTLYLRRLDGIFKIADNLSQLGALKTLTMLSLEQNQSLLDAHLLELASIGTLQSLDLRNCASITAAGIRAMCKARKAPLTELLLAGAAKFTVAELALLTAEFPYIKAG